MKSPIWITILMVGVACISGGSDHQTIFIHPKHEMSITFIMGQDKPGKNYFQYAKEYFVKNQKNQTDIVTESCNTIECVIEYLNGFHNKKWQTINLVAHGNSKTGLNLFLSKDGHKATPKRMLQEVLVSNLPRIKEGIIGKDSKIYIWSCGIGTNPMINVSMKQIFAPISGDSAHVICSPYFVVFKPDKQGEIQKIEANYWPYYYKRGYRPSDEEINQKMKSLYPSKKRKWDEHLENNNQEKTHTIDYHLPIVYTRKYENAKDRPDFAGEKDKIKWVQSQKSIMSQLEEIDMSYDDFHWQVNKIKSLQEDGTYLYAVKAIGMTTVLCFLEEV